MNQRLLIARPDLRLQNLRLQPLTIGAILRAEQNQDWVTGHLSFNRFDRPVV